MRWFFDTIPGNGKDTLHNRSSQYNRVVNGSHRLHIIYYAAHICRKHGRIDLTACGSINKGTLASLWIFGHQFLYLYPRNILYKLLHFSDTVRFVVLNTDISLCLIKNSQDNAKAFHNLLRMIQHSPVVAGKVWLALRTIDQDKFNLIRILRCKFYMSGKACSSKSYHTGFLDTLQNVLSGQFFQTCRSKFHFFILSVILDHNGIHHGTGSHESRFNRLHSTGHRRMNRSRYKSSGLGNHLPCQYMVSFRHHWFCWCTDVLGKRINQLSFRQIFFHRTIFGQFLSVIRMYATLKG